MPSGGCVVRQLERKVALGLLLHRLFLLGEDLRLMVVLGCGLLLRLDADEVDGVVLSAVVLTCVESEGHVDLVTDVELGDLVA